MSQKRPAKETKEFTKVKNVTNLWKHRSGSYYRIAKVRGEIVKEKLGNDYEFSKRKLLNVSLYWHAQRIETLLPSGKRNPAAGIMLALLAEMARNEMEVLRERINSGLAEARRKGVTLGRPKGTRISAQASLKKHADIVRLLKAGHSIRHSAKITGKGNSTVQRVKALIG